jgi:periplasmic divalent cation tolerance protein
MTNVVLILTTVPTAERGEAIALALVEQRLAACVSVLPPMVSLYRWKGAIERDVECQLVVKTASDRVAAVQARVKALHPYELPEFVVLHTAEAEAEYRSWVDAATRPPA